MRTENPLVSVVMPVYNAAPFVKQAVESILTQTYKNFEFIIIDDASKDNSHEIVKKLARRDKRIRLLRNKKNIGIGATMNKLLSEVKGDFIARMDADDVAYPTRLEKQVNYLLENPDVGIVGSFMNEINEKNEFVATREVPLIHEEISEQFMTMQAIQNPTLMFNKNLVLKEELYYKDTLSPVDDLDFYFRQLWYVKFANIPEYLMSYRKHSSNSSLKDIKKTFKLSLKVRIDAIRKYGYKPTFRGIITVFAQLVVVNLLPNKWIYPVYSLLRGMKKVGVSFVVTKPRLVRTKLAGLLNL
jgi:glycosyltransferase involved in cell wall biosynthesis